MNRGRALRMHPGDNVATALLPLEARGVCSILGDGDACETLVREPIPVFHKIALQDIPAGAVIRKYGESIGVASKAIWCGSHVHVHNLVSQRAQVRR